MIDYSIKRKCLVCGKEFTIDHPRRKFCSDPCRIEHNKQWEKKHNVAKRLRAKQRAWEVKKQLMESLGGKCVTCKNKDLRVLEFAHKDSNNKHPRLKKREKMNQLTKWKLLEKEAKKGLVVLKCTNCHRIETHEEFWSNDVV